MASRIPLESGNTYSPAPHGEPNAMNDAPALAETLHRLAMVLAGLFSFSAEAGAVDHAPTPPLPFYDWGACPFECCTYRQWTVTVRTRVLAKPKQEAKAVFDLVPGDTVKALTGVVITSRAVLATVNRRSTLDELPIQPGDSVYVLHAEGEGYWRVWFRGHVASALVNLSTEPDQDPEAEISMPGVPRCVWWAKVANGSGKIGWARVSDNFAHTDACE